MDVLALLAGKAETEIFDFVATRCFILVALACCSQLRGHPLDRQFLRGGELFVDGDLLLLPG